MENDKNKILDKFCIAVYLRVSKKEKSEKESSSIKNQRNLLLQFIENQKEFIDSSILEFLDDGYSGTNFQRPGVLQLLKQVKEGKINCIVVKDISRFSRDYIELGVYLEQIFPFLGVRFIALNDNYDSIKCQEIGMDFASAFQNIFYDWYSKDLSIKVRTSLKTRKEKGEYISPNPPYGYQKDRKEKGCVIICKEEASVVQMIFSFALEGKTDYKIAKFLNQQKIPTRTSHALWRASTVSQILQNQFYIGDMLYNKYKKDRVGGKSYLRTREEWDCILHHHKALIEKEVFKEVQNIRKEKREKQEKEQDSYFFSGKVWCGICHKKLQIRNKGNPYLSCETIKKVVQQSIGQVILIKRAYFEQEKEKLQKKIQQTLTEQERVNKKKGIEYRKYLCSSKKKELYIKWKKQIQDREKKLMQLQLQYHTKIELLKQIEENRNICEELAEMFVKKIIVFDRQKVIIFWNFQRPEKKKNF